MQLPTWLVTGGIGDRQHQGTPNARIAVSPADATTRIRITSLEVDKELAPLRWELRRRKFEQPRPCLSPRSTMFGGAWW